MPTPAAAGAVPRAITALVRPAAGRLARAGTAGGHLAAGLLAASLGHVLPLVGRFVLRRLARARMARGAAVVLPGLGDPVALLLVAAVLGVVRIRGLRESQRDEARDRRLHELAG